MSSPTEPKVDQPHHTDTQAAPRPRPLPPPDAFDPVIEVYKQDVDRTLLRENLNLTPQQRSERFEQMMEMVFELRRHAHAPQDEA